MVQYIPGYTGGWQHPRSDGNMDSTAKIPGMKGPKESLEEETRRGLIVPFRLPAASIDSCCRTVCGRVHVDEEDEAASSSHELGDRIGEHIASIGFVFTQCY